MRFISLASILTELQRHKHLMIIGVGARSSDPISIILPPFDSSHHNESNGMRFISLASILTELRLFIKAFNIIWPKLRLILAKYFRNTKLITEFEINYGIQNFLMNYLIITELRNYVFP